jgi:hypothetical protein
MMFKKPFDGIVDICRPGKDDPICQFGGSTDNSETLSAAASSTEEPNADRREKKKP